MYAQLTVAGHALLNGDQPVVLTEYRLGSGHGYLPDEVATGLVGTEVYRGVPEPLVVARANLAKSTIYLAPEVGPFQFGEVALYAGATLFAVVVSPDLIDKAKTDDQEGSIKIDTYFPMSESLLTGYALLLEESNELRLGVMPEVDLLPPAHLSPQNAFVIQGTGSDVPPVFAYSDRNKLWRFDRFMFFKENEKNVSAASATSVSIPVNQWNQKFTPSYTGRVLLQFVTGDCAGLCKYVKSASLSQDSQAMVLGLSSAVLTIPKQGDKIVLYTCIEEATGMAFANPISAGIVRVKPNKPRIIVDPVSGIMDLADQPILSVNGEVPDEEGNLEIHGLQGPQGLQGLPGEGSGDMLKATYDTNNNGMVDEAEAVEWSGVKNKPVEGFTPAAHNHNPANISEDATHRFVTDVEKTTWNSKIDSSARGANNGVAPLDGSGKIPIANIPSGIGGGGLTGFRNLLINGCMRVRQRYGGSALALTAGGPAKFVLDRFYVAIGAAVGTVNASQGGFLSSGKLALVINPLAGSFGSLRVGQSIEAKDTRHLVGSNLAISARLGLGGTAQARTVTWTAYYPSVADNYTTKTQIATGDWAVTSTEADFAASISNLPAGVANGIRIEFTCVGSTVPLYIGQVQAEEGTAATVFERRPIGTEIALCQRYFEKSYPQDVAVGTGGNADGIVMVISAAVASGSNYAPIRYLVTKRVSPAVTAYSFTSATPNMASQLTGTDLASNSATMGALGEAGFTVNNTSGGTINPAAGGFCFHYAADAEIAG